MHYRHYYHCNKCWCTLHWLFATTFSSALLLTEMKGWMMSSEIGMKANMCFRIEKPHQFNTFQYMRAFCGAILQNMHMVQEGVQQQRTGQDDYNEIYHIGGFFWILCGYYAQLMLPWTNNIRTLTTCAMGFNFKYFDKDTFGYFLELTGLLGCSE